MNEPLTLQGEHSNTRFESLELSSTTIHGASYEGCRFAGCQLEGLHFRDCRFVDCLFESCNLVTIGLTGSTMLDVRFSGGRAMGVDWVGLRRLTLALRFENVRMDYANFTGMPLQRTLFEGCSLRGAAFTEADISHARFTGSDLQDATIRHAKLLGTDLRGTRGCHFDATTCATGKTLVDVDTAVTLLHALGVRCPDLGG
jgi:fluoroquinolone resistance protein